MNFKFSTEQTENSSEVSFHSSEVSFDSSEVSFDSSEVLDLASRESFDFKIFFATLAVGTSEMRNDPSLGVAVHSPRH